MNLPAGTYQVEVSSFGEFADLGVYDLRIGPRFGAGPQEEPKAATDSITNRINLDPATNYWDQVVLSLTNDIANTSEVFVDRSTDAIFWTRG